MTTATKYDQNKPRPDLIPWREFYSQAIDHGVEATAQALTIWAATKPLALELSIPTRQLPGIARVLAFGAAKYGDRNWESGIQYSRLLAAALRHADEVNRGEFIDPESGLAHESHFWCNVLFLVVFTARGRIDLDDRSAPVASEVRRMDALKTLVDQFNAINGDVAPREPEPTKDSN